MKQREIKIPLKCNTFRRLIVLGIILILNYLFYLTYSPINLNGIIIINGFVFGLWGLWELLIWIFARVENEQPILPFKFKCKCEDEN